MCRGRPASSTPPQRPQRPQRLHTLGHPAVVLPAAQSRDQSACETADADCVEAEARNDRSPRQAPAVPRAWQAQGHCKLGHWMYAGHLMRYTTSKPERTRPRAARRKPPVRSRERLGRVEAWPVSLLKARLRSLDEAKFSARRQRQRLESISGLSRWHLATFLPLDLMYNTKHLSEIDHETNATES